MIDKRFILSAVTLTILSVCGFLFWYIPHYSSHAIHATAECTEIFKAKDAGYFTGTGQSRFVFNKKMNTCLILNTLDDQTTGEFRVILVDMITDDILFYYDLPKDQTKDATLGLTKDEALQKVRSFGFVIF